MLGKLEVMAFLLLFRRLRLIIATIMFVRKLYKSYRSSQTANK